MSPKCYVVIADSLFLFFSFFATFLGDIREIGSRSALFFLFCSLTVDDREFGGGD
jgi:hypothetical protein